MKRSKMMRFAAVLLVCVILTVAVVGGIFAKYVTAKEATDTARVAKFGVTVNAAGTTFAKEYAKETDSTKITVKSSTEDNVVAPGTKGEMAAITLSGSPEVAVKVSYAAEFELTGWEIPVSGSDPKYYCPITITVNGTKISGLNYDDAAAFKADVEDAIAGYSKEYEPGTDLSTKDADALSVSWAWAFEGTAGSAQTDANDTALGNAGTAPTLSLKVTTTVTQID